MVVRSPPLGGTTLAARGVSLHRVFAVVARDCATAAPICCCTVSEQESITRNGFAVLMSCSVFIFHTSMALEFLRLIQHLLVKSFKDPMNSYLITSANSSCGSNHSSSIANSFVIKILKSSCWSLLVSLLCTNSFCPKSMLA